MASVGIHLLSSFFGWASLELCEFITTVFIESSSILHWAVHSPIAFHNFKSHKTLVSNSRTIALLYAIIPTWFPYFLLFCYPYILIHVYVCGQNRSNAISLKSHPCFICLHAGPLNSDGQLSNFVHFQNCTFTGNIAEQFGAAMGFTSFLVFQNVENVRSFEIESWWEVYVKLQLQFL